MLKKPCPFCGCDDVVTESHPVGGRCYKSYVECQQCDARGPEFWGAWPAEAAEEAWNERTEDAR